MHQTRFLLTLSAAGLLALTACTAAEPSADTSDTDDAMMEASSAPFYLDDESSSAGEVELNVSSMGAASSAPQAAASESTTNGMRTITVNVTDWSFSPAMITAKKGEKVKLKIVGGTGIHSFAVPGLSMNVRIAAGETVTVDLPTDVEGSFDARCAIPCGPGHRDMKATVVIS